ncbi:expressed unknown protein [Seminavis robusta]|uniref:Uncharacterized protein n=1 Tax=Seminavis robusta TaxID=568900 RepID=A0A9N8DAS9_9STRA|nr:expressed unknown protein [Seminavis robusta]|eukprot:Sro57_g033110.1 n/a (297) ;mRNA; f:7958-8848
MIPYRSWTALLVLLLASLVADCHARCAATSSDPRERFSESDFVLRLQYDPSSTATIPCGVRTYQITSQGSEQSVDTTGFEQYTILDIYKQDWDNFFASEATLNQGQAVITPDAVNLQVGDAIALIYFTDTGYSRNIPQYIRDDADGSFLAFLSPHRYCNSPSDGAVTTLPEVTPENLQTNPFVLSQCDQGNQGWSAVPQDGRLFLESQVVGIETNNQFDVSKNATTPTSNSTEPEEVGDNNNATDTEILDLQDDVEEDNDSVFVAEAAVSSVGRRMVSFPVLASMILGIIVVVSIC